MSDFRTVFKIIIRPCVSCQIRKTCFTESNSFIQPIKERRKNHFTSVSFPPVFFFFTFAFAFAPVPNIFSCRASVSPTLQTSISSRPWLCFSSFSRWSWLPRPPPREKTWWVAWRTSLACWCYLPFLRGFLKEKGQIKYVIHSHRHIF